VITVLASAKGGSGKTTLSTALSAEAARRGVKTLLVDADTQANASEWLAGGGGMLASVGDGGRGVYRLFIDGEEPAPLSVRPCLDLLPAGARTQSLASELDRMLTMSLEQKRQGLTLVRELLHEATSAYEQVWIDTPPSLQSPSLIESFLAAADFVVVPFRASPDHARAAYKVIEQLVALDELGVEHAKPLGVVIFDRDAAATRLEASVRQELDKISQYVPLFAESVIHRASPAAAALRMHMTPHELVAAAPSNSERLARLRDGTTADLPSIQRETVEKYAANFAAVYDEFLARVGTFAHV
jgi:chromosome partitioning protein